MNYNGTVQNNDIEMVLLAFSTGKRQNDQEESKGWLRIFFRFWRGIYSTRKRELEKNIWLYGLIGIAFYVHMYMLFHDGAGWNETDIFMSTALFDLVLVLTVFLIGRRWGHIAAIGYLDFLLHFYCIFAMALPKNNIDFYRPHFINLIPFCHAMLLLGAPFYRSELPRWKALMVSVILIIINFIVEMLLLINQAFLLVFIFSGGY